MTYVAECYRAQYWELETECGTETIPCDVFDWPGIVSLPNPFPEFVERLAPYIEGTRVEFAERRTGWLARLTMPGCLDCTEWVRGETEREALEALVEMYGTQDDAPPEDWERDVWQRLAELTGEPD